jgi:hypothetical protein
MNLGLLQKRKSTWGLPTERARHVLLHVTSSVKRPLCRNTEPHVRLSSFRSPVEHLRRFLEYSASNVEPFP